MPRGFCRVKHGKEYLQKCFYFSLLLGYAKTGLTGCVQRLQINYKLYRQRVLQVAFSLAELFAEGRAYNLYPARLLSLLNPKASDVDF